MRPLSASQVELFRRCERKWAFRYTTTLPKREFTAATDLGGQVHKIAEEYQRTGALPEEGDALRIFMPALPFMPTPKTGHPEHRFDVKFDDVGYMGYMDWYAQRDTPAVYDYKTSSDPAKYGLKGRSDFLTHVQPLMYANAAMELTQASDVYLRWIYMKTKGKPKAFMIDATLGDGEVDEAFQRIVHTPAKRIVALRVLRDLDPNDLAPNRGACHDFNSQCEYAAYCRPDTVAVGENMIDLLAHLEDLTSSDTKPSQAPANDVINRGAPIAKRVSSRPPKTEKGVVIVAYEPEKKTGETPAPTPSAPPAASKPQSNRPGVAMRSPTAIILEELAGALSRAAERIG